MPFTLGRTDAIHCLHANGGGGLEIGIRVVNENGVCSPISVLPKQILVDLPV